MAYFVHSCWTAQAGSKGDQSGHRSLCGWARGEACFWHAGWPGAGIALLGPNCRIGLGGGRLAGWPAAGIGGLTAAACA